MRSRLIAGLSAPVLVIGGAIGLAVPAHASPAATDITTTATVPAVNGFGPSALGAYVGNIEPEQFTAASSGSLDSITAALGYATGGFTVGIFAADQVSIGSANGLTQLQDDLYVGTPLASATAPANGGAANVTATFGQAPSLVQGQSYWLVMVGAGGQPLWVNAYQTGNPIGHYENGSAWYPSSWAAVVDVELAAGPIWVSLSPSTSNGWNTSPVTATYSCSATVDLCPSPVTYDTDGVYTPSGTVTLNSGATSFDWTNTVKLDQVAPTGSVALDPSTPNGANGWYTALPTPTLTDADTTSGIDADATTGPQQTGPPDATALTFGIADLAGNTSSVSSAAFKYDPSGPVLDPAVNGTAGANGWFTSSATVSWQCSDVASGVASCPGPTTFTADGVHPAVDVSATNNAGLATAASTPVVSIDETPPTITGTTTLVPNSGFRVTWTCSDATAGIDSCPGPTYVSGVGSDTVATAVATDLAGNTATGQVTGLVSGVHAPSITIRGVRANKRYKYGTTLTPSCSAVATLSSPALVPRSGLACTGTRTHHANKSGSVSWSYVARATDARAGGGTAVRSVEWTVSAKVVAAKVTFALAGLPAATRGGRPVISHTRSYDLTVQIRGKNGKVMKGKPVWLHSVTTNHAGTKGRPTVELHDFYRSHGSWVMSFTPGYDYAGHYRKFGVVAPDGTRHYWVIYVR